MRPQATGHRAQVTAEKSRATARALTTKDTEGRKGVRFWGANAEEALTIRIKIALRYDMGGTRGEDMTTNTDVEQARSGRAQTSLRNAVIAMSIAATASVLSALVAHWKTYGLVRQGLAVLLVAHLIAESIRRIRLDRAGKGVEPYELMITGYLWLGMATMIFSGW